MRLVAGFEEPTAGNILLDGTDVARLPAHKRNVNTVFQSYALFPFLTVAENVAFGLKYKSLSNRSQPSGSATPSSWSSSTVLRGGAPAELSVASSSGARSPTPSC